MATEAEPLGLDDHWEKKVVFLFFYGMYLVLYFLETYILPCVEKFNYYV
jgi:hypothetical protein